MRKVTWIRFGVAVSLATIGVVGALAAGCSDDEPAPGTNKDSGTDAPKTETGPTTDSGPDGSKPDGGGTDAADAAPQPVVKLIIVHAAPSFGEDNNPNPATRAFRMCFATSAPGAAPVVSPLTALPDTQTAGQKAAGLPPGVYSGTGGPLPQFPIDPSQIEITPFAIFADKIAGQTSADAGQNNCADLLGSDGQGTGTALLKKGTDYVQLKTVPAGTFALGNTYLLAFLGCKAGKGASGVAQCGGDYVDATGNLQVGIAKLDNKDPVFAADSGAGVGLGVQVAHRAAAIQGLLGNPSPAANGLIFGYIGATVVQPPPFDAGPDADPDAAAPDTGGPTIVPTVFPLVTPPTQYSADKVAPVPAAAVHLPDNLNTPVGFFVPSPDGGPLSPAPLTAGGNRLIALPLANIHQLSTGAPPGDAGTLFAAGHSYTFVLLGDPTAAQLPNPDGGPGINPAYDGRGIHIIAFPNDPVVPTL